MKARANTRVTILRGEGTDGFGDPVDLGKPVAQDITAWIAGERVSSGGGRSMTATTAKDDMPRTVRYHPCRLPAGTDVRDGDRIKDQRTGRIYVIDSIGEPESYAQTPDLRLDLRRVT